MPPASNPRTKPVWDGRLVCFVLGLTYDYQTHTGALHMDEGSCCDMGRCIGIFRAIDPGVRRINTYAGQKQDTIYKKVRGGWQARRPILDGTKWLVGDVYQIT